MVVASWVMAEVMPIHPDQFPRLAAKKATSPEVALLFTELARRAETFAKMLGEFAAEIAGHRVTREWKPVRVTAKQQQLLNELAVDPDKAEREIERFVANMDDAALLNCAFMSIKQQIRLDERMFNGWHDCDKAFAQRLIEYEKETMRLVQQCIASHAG